MATKRGLGHRDRNLAIEIRAVALEEFVRLDRNEDVEIARRTAAETGLALTGKTDTGAGMLTESARSWVTRPWPWQLVQGSSIVWPRPLQVGQVRSIEKKPDAARTRPAPPQVEHVTGSEPGLEPEPLQTSQVIEDGTWICAVLPS